MIDEAYNQPAAAPHLLRDEPIAKEEKRGEEGGHASEVEGPDLVEDRPHCGLACRHGRGLKGCQMGL